MFNAVLGCKQQSNVTDVLEKLCEVDACFTNRLEETACKTGIDHRRFFRMYTQCVIRDISFFISHPYTQKCKLFQHIGFSPVGICITG